jgi:hypothetical protein
MEEEKILKDLTKKYAELAKKIHSKDKRSVSLIKDCSKRIALLDKLRVLEVSYLKCLKNKVKKGHKGGELTEEQIKQQEEEAAKQQEAAYQQDTANKQEEADKQDTTNKQEDANQEDDENKFRAIVACTRAVDGSIYALSKVKETGNNAAAIFKENAGNLFENTTGISVEKARTKGAIFQQNAEKFVEKKTGISLDDVKANMTNAANVVKANATTLATNAVNKLGNLLTRKNSGATGGSKKTTYRLNGEKVVLLHKNKKVQRSIYVKGNGKTKYCKIDHQYILLSKLKNKIQ